MPASSARPRSVLRSTTRTAHLLALLVAAAVDGLLRKPGTLVDRSRWRHRWCLRIVKALGLECNITGPLPGSGALVSNHLTYLDVLFYGAATPFIMVAKADIRRWPLIGWITARAGTVYVSRRGDQAREEVDRHMAAGFASGLPVLFYPEGTTSDGITVLPFRRGLFHSVFENRAPLHTAAIHYTLDTPGSTATVAEDVCYWGDMTFAPHIFRVLGLTGIQGHIRFNEHPLTEARDKADLALQAHAAVSAALAKLQIEQDTSPSANYESETWTENNNQLILKSS